MATIPKEFAEYLFILQQWRPTHKEWNERKLSEPEKEGHSFQKQKYFLFFISKYFQQHPRILRF